MTPEPLRDLTTGAMQDPAKYTKDPFGILSDDEWDELHADLAEMAALRRAAEVASAHVPMCGVVAPGWRRCADWLAGVGR